MKVGFFLSWETGKARCSFVQFQINQNYIYYGKFYEGSTENLAKDSWVEFTFEEGFSY